MSVAWQPRWVAYAAHEGRTPDEQDAHDRRADGTFLAHPFMAWVGAAWAAWCAKTGRPLHGLNADHEAFDAWLPTYQADAGPNQEAAQ